MFAAHVVFKGEVHEEQAVVSAGSSAGCGLSLSGDGPFVVFAGRGPDLPEGRYTASSCGGTGPADPAVLAELTGLTQLTTSTGGPGALPLEGRAGTAGSGSWGVVLGLGG